jgi:hypothetical protein
LLFQPSWGLGLGLLAIDGHINFPRKFTINNVIVLNGLGAQDITNVIVGVIHDADCTLSVEPHNKAVLLCKLIIAPRTWAKSTRICVSLSITPLCDNPLLFASDI